MLIFDRRLMRRGKRPTPGRFRTRVITEGVTPSLHVDYKHTRIKQYHNCDTRSHVVSEFVDWRVGRCRRRSSGSVSGTCPRRDVRDCGSTAVGAKLTGKPKGPRSVRGPQARGRLGGVNTSEPLLMPR